MTDLAWRPLCPVYDIPPGETAAFPRATAEAPGLFAVHHFRDGILIYRNACPHLGVPLDWAPGKFLNLDGTRIICATHGAEFRITDGLCLRGPCRGQKLVAMPVRVVAGVLMVGETTECV
jgi:nitrite reductase/ring-hydroxylating ferredoxin subunit